MYEHGIEILVAKVELYWSHVIYTHLVPYDISKVVISCHDFKFLKNMDMYLHINNS